MIDSRRRWANERERVRWVGGWVSVSRVSDRSYCREERARMGRVAGVVEGSGLWRSILRRNHVDSGT